MKIDTFILKIASQCNLNCSYCHIYNMGDIGYKYQPKFIENETIISFSKALEQYTIEENIKTVFISFHGGEPLLINRLKFQQILNIINEKNKHINIVYLIQTNGVLLNKDWAEILKENNVHVGVSLDGVKKINDRYRKFHNGRGSYDVITRNIKNLQQYDIVEGIISVVDVDTDPSEFYYHMKSINSNQLNILLPNINYHNIPDFYKPVDDFIKKVGCWMIDLYKCWKYDTSRVDIPFFELIIKLLSGYKDYGNQLVGNCTNGVAVLETNGDIEVIDSLRISYNGATRTGNNISQHKISSLHDNDLFIKYYYSHIELPFVCRSCSIKKICGGGFIVHRFNKDFNNPSIYCESLYKIINYIKKDLFK
ncbi:radical SAM protein [Riemerella anatipestifer]|nr:radical SAM protein [Riemerella anatipestifer]MDY3358734.1 radical SAM protein [Riemerella anatipestifer]